MRCKKHLKKCVNLFLKLGEKKKNFFTFCLLVHEFLVLKFSICESNIRNTEKNFWKKRGKLFSLPKVIFFKINSQVSFQTQWHKLIFLTFCYWSNLFIYHYTCASNNFFFFKLLRFFLRNLHTRSNKIFCLTWCWL